MSIQYSSYTGITHFCENVWNIRWNPNHGSIVVIIGWCYSVPRVCMWSHSCGGSFCCCKSSSCTV